MSLLSCQRPCWFLPSSSKRHGPSHQLKEVLILSLHHQEERWPYAFSAWGWQPGVCFWVHQIQHGQHVRRGSSPPVFSIDAASAWILHDPDDLWMSLPSNYSVIPFYSFSILFCFVPLHFIQFPTRSMPQAEKDEQMARGLLFFSFTSGFCLSRNETSMRSCLAAGQTAGPAPLWRCWISITFPNQVVATGPERAGWCKLVQNRFVSVLISMMSLSGLC